MNEPTEMLRPSRSVQATLVLFGLLAAALLATGRKDFPSLHTVLDTGMFLLLGALSMLLWDMGRQIDRPLTRWIAVTFMVTSLLEFVHLMVSVEWSGPLAFISRNAGVLRPATWPPAAHLLPIGVGFSIWLSHRGARGTLGLAAALVFLGAGLVVVFRWLPFYTAPTWFGITRPALLLAPLLWLMVGWSCWRRRLLDRIWRPLALMAGVLVLAHLSMLYSQAPHDAPAMVAHLGKVGGYLVLLLSLMQMASLDTRALISMEYKLARSNEELERRVLARTTQLEAINQSLEAEMTARRQAEERVRMVVEASPNAMIMTNEDGRIAMVNAQVEKLFGYPRTELLDRAIEILVPERFRASHPGLRRAFFALPQARLMGAGRDLYGLRKDGSEVPIEIGLNPITMAQGRFVLASIIDITPRKQAEAEIRLLNADLERRVRERTAQLDATNQELVREISDRIHTEQELRRRSEELRSANRELESFSYSVAHDLRTPLRAVGGFSQILVETCHNALDEEGKRLLGVIRNEAERMGVLIDALLRFSRLGSHQVKHSTLDMTALARSTFQELLRDHPSRVLRLEVQALPPALGEEALVRQVFIHLLSNAIKFTRQREVAVIEVGAQIHPGQNIYYVKDNGVGFDERYVEKLFGMFQRLHHDEEFEGTGVGLALVQRILLRHGGRVWAESKLNEGATVYFTLPT